MSHQLADSSWKARIREGVVEYNTLNPPAYHEVPRAIRGLDGGDLALPLAQGHGPVAVDGGDLEDGQWQWPASPLLADGGVAS